MNDFESALLAPNFADPVAGYRKYVNLSSMIDYFLFEELGGWRRRVQGLAPAPAVLCTAALDAPPPSPPPCLPAKNYNDGFRGSQRLFKDAGGPINFGPPWVRAPVACQPAISLPTGARCAWRGRPATSQQQSLGRASPAPPAQDFDEAFGTCCGWPIEGYQDGGASNGSSGGSAISPEGCAPLVPRARAGPALPARPSLTRAHPTPSQLALQHLPGPRALQD